jgi:hypothetical protein
MFEARAEKAATKSTSKKSPLRFLHHYRSAFAERYRRFRSGLDERRRQGNSATRGRTFKPAVYQLEDRLAPATGLAAADPCNLAGGFDGTFAGIHTQIENAVSDVGNLPLIADKFDSAVQPMVNLVDSARSKLDNFVQNVMTELRDNPNADPLSVFNAGLYQVFGAPGLGILLHDNSNGTSTPSNSVSNIVVTQGNDLDSSGNAVPNTTYFQWNMHLGQSFSITVPFDHGTSLQQSRLAATACCRASMPR